MLEVIGVGWGRTGTLSLKVALERLGFGPCYHAVEAMKRPEHAAAWQAAAAGEPGWMNVFDGYRATVDFPGAAYWRELVDAHPDAKVILTVRDPRRWYASVRETFLEDHGGVAAGADEVLRQAGRSEEEASDFGAGLEAMMGDFQEVLRSEDEAVAAFERHNADVAGYVPAERLLVFEAKHGWAPLGAFLGVSTPESEPFPHINEAAAFDELIPRLIAGDDQGA